MGLEVPQSVSSRVEGRALVVLDGRTAVEHRLTSSARTVFELIARGASRHDVVAALSTDPFVGPIRASDVYDAVTAGLRSDGLVVASSPATATAASLVARATRRVYPWYDSLWLGKWMGARDLARRENPALEGELVAMVKPLRTDPAFETRDLGVVADSAQLERIRSVVAGIDPDSHEGHEAGTFGRAVVHNHPFFTEMQHSLLRLASEAAGEELEVSYNFLSLYTDRGVCAPHLDAPSAKYTVDMCIDQSDPWPIHISQVVPWPEDDGPFDGDWSRRVRERPDLHFRAHTLEPGRAILFSGPSQWHYRDPHPNPDAGFCTLIFFHFIPKGTSEVVRLFEN